MSIASNLLAEFEHEATITRKFLERVPADKLEWRCHEKSHTIGELALHIAKVPGGVLMLTLQDNPELPDFGKGWEQPKTVQEIIDGLDWSIQTVRHELPKLEDAKLTETWTGMKGGKAVLSMPRVAMLRSVMLNHWYQHRGQLGVYLRLTGEKCRPATGLAVTKVKPL